MKVFVLATTNAHKAEEMRGALAGQAIDLRPRPVDLADVDETEPTLEGNALLKARAVAEATGLAAVADDTGLFVDALDGRPGVHSARYASEHASDQENVAKLLSELADVASPQRGAHFRTVIALAQPDGRSWTEEGRLDGAILFAPVGAGGFGYDVVFAPTELDGRSLAELDFGGKLAISHRGRALRAFANRVARE